VSKITLISRIVLAKPTGLCMQLLIMIPRSLSLSCPFLVNHLGIFAKIVVMNSFSTPGEWFSRPLTSREDNSLNYSMMTLILLNHLPRMRGSWLELIDYSNSLCVRAIRVIVNHALISKYWLRFFLRKNFMCPCGACPIESRRYILLWNALDTNIFLFLLSIFLDFIFLFF